MAFFKTLSFIVGGPIGLAAAVAVESRNKNSENRRREEKEEAFKAGAASAERKYEEKLGAVYEKLRQSLAYEKHVLALFALGSAVASVDGKITADEKRDIEEFVAGVSAKGLPEAILADIRRLYENPPSVDQALIYIKASGVARDVVEDLVEVVIQADDYVAPEEWQFKLKWENYKKQYAA
jgi:hypothetical protein